jgi:hypothetical protein
MEKFIVKDSYKAINLPDINNIYPYKRLVIRNEVMRKCGLNIMK